MLKMVHTFCHLMFINTVYRPDGVRTSLEQFSFYRHTIMVRMDTLKCSIQFATVI